jgi:hypothetical protein
VRESLVLGSFDVVFMTDARRLTKGETARVHEVVSQALYRLRNQGGVHIKLNEDANFIEWVKDGIECEAMTANGSGWIKGKVRFCLEFIPDPVPEPEEILIKKEPESPLDEFRQQKQ